MRSRIVAAIVVIFLVFVGGVFVGRVFPAARRMQGSEVSESNTSYKFINPLLFCQDQNLSNQDANDMENTISNYIAQEKRTGDIIDASFYFRDLNGGPWALVNPDFRSIPSSLLKVPTAISVYQHAEQDPTFLSTTVTFKGDTNENASEHFQPKETLQPHTTYTMEDLVRFMLQDSDNDALLLLVDRINVNELTASYTHLGIDLPKTADKQDYTMTVKTYSSFFRILYNGTYLSQSSSEHLLSLLSGSSFTQGLIAGLPAGMVVAHKFGEASLPDGTRQLHDCGIVYKPSQPYLICVMTKGTNFDTLAGVISHISKTVYQTLQSQE